MLNQIDDDAATEQNEKLAPLYMIRKMYHEKEVLKAVVESCTDVNQRMLENNFLTLKMPDLIGCTPLHFAEKEYNTNLLYLLLKKGADYYIKNSKHHTIVHEALISSNYCKDYLDYDLQFWLPEQDPYSLDCPFIDDILKSQVNLGNSTNPCDKNGLSHFHIACLAKNTRAVELFLENGVSSEAVSKNSAIMPGFTPLHIATKHNSYSVVDILLKNNANKDLKDSRGMSCLHILMEERLKYAFCKSMRSRLRKNPTCMLMHLNENKRTLEVLLGKAATWDPNVTDDIGLSYFHVACMLQDISIVEELIQKVSNINQAVNMDSFIWSGYTALHFAAHFHLETVSLLVKNGADLEIADVKGLTPFEICLQRFTAEEICSLLKLKTDWENMLFSDGKTKLFDLIYAMRNRDAFEEFLTNKVANINMYIPSESCVAAGFTPLHFAVIATGIAKTNLKACENVDYQAPYDVNVQNNAADTERYYMYIALCLQLGADVTIQDKRGLTPLHLSFQLNEYHTSRLLYRNHDKIVNLIDMNGMSHFHIACVVSDTELIKKLLSINQNIINEPVKSSFCYFPKIRKLPVSIKINDGSTPLHIAVAIQNFVLIELLVEYNVDISAKDVEGLTPLDVAIFIHKEYNKLPKFYQDIPRSREILKLLVKCNCNAIAQKYSSSIPLKQILHECDALIKNLMVLELDQQNIIQRCVLEDMGITMLHIACALDNFGKIQQLLDEGANVNDQISLDSPIWPGYTPLHISMSLTPSEGDTPIQVDEDLTDGIPFTRSLKSMDYSAAVQLLLNHGADVTIINAENSSPIHEGFECLWYGKDDHLYKLSLVNRFHLCPSYKLLVKAQKNFTVDPVSVQGMSHFHVACALDEVQTVKQFLEHGVDLSQKINSFAKHFGGYTPLHFAVRFKSKSTVDLLLEYGADINSKDVMGNTPLHIFAINSSSCVDILQSLLSNGANMNINNLTGESCFETILRLNRATVEAINIYKKHGCLFNSYNSITTQGCLTILLKANDKEVMEAVLNALDIVAEDDMGRTLIHNLVTIIKHGGNYTTEDRSVEDEFIPWENYWMAIGKLTKHGFDINHQDKEGLTALHIAAQRRNYSGIIGLLKNGADVNVTDAAGKTALVYSVEIAISSWDVRCTPVDFEILLIFFKHVHKLMMFKLEITIQNVVTYNRVKHLFEEEQKENFIHDEIVKIDDEKWHICFPLVTLGSFLQDIRPVASFMMSRENCEKVHDFFENNATILDQEFPELSSILLLRYREARARVELIQLASNCLGLVVGFDMPFLCAEAIFKFLRNSDLKNIIDASSLE